LTDLEKGRSKVAGASQRVVHEKGKKGGKGPLLHLPSSTRRPRKGKKKKRGFQGALSIASRVLREGRGGRRSFHLGRRRERGENRYTSGGERRKGGVFLFPNLYLQRGEKRRAPLFFLRRRKEGKEELHIFSLVIDRRKGEMHEFICWIEVQDAYQGGEYTTSFVNLLIQKGGGKVKGYY